MKPVDQSIMHDPANGRFGDCQRACLASLLELHIEQVPHFLHDDCDTKTFNERMGEFLGGRGLWLLAISPIDFSSYKENGHTKGDVHHLIYGPSPRSTTHWHCVVGCNGEMVFDPHPSRLGLVGKERVFAFLSLVDGLPLIGSRD